MTAEWLETDGLGGFAMGTADGIRTRRYHGLLTMATPTGRVLLVADLEVIVETPAGRFALTSHRYQGGAVYPDGASRIARFEWRPWPRWEWSLPGGTRIACELVVARGAPQVALRWMRLGGTATALHVQPLFAARDYHSLHKENGAFRFDPEIAPEHSDEDAGDHLTWHPYDGVPPIYCAANALYQHTPDWYRNFYYAADDERGLDCVEDLAAPGVLTFDLAAGAAALVFAAQKIERGAADEISHMFGGELERRGRVSSQLARAADAYIVKRGTATTIVAGYPWFTEWGRDAFVSLRGLCLATDRRADARAVLLRWAGALSEGMLPNRFAERDGAPEYNSVDAALWFVVAADAYLTSGDVDAGDRERLQRAIRDIVDAYAAGTRHGIRADADGLLACGEPGVQLTWMDARVNGEVVTPRIGKPVEIQALWINALAIAGRTADADRAQAAFAAAFWDATRAQLHDVIGPDGAPDPSVRPNQILAIGGLPRQIFTGPNARAVVDTVERLLVTDAGLRTLAPGDARYHPHYTGESRDLGYHNGAVWPWLMGPFIEAWLRVRGSTVEAKREARARFLTPLIAHAHDGGLGHLPELCDGDPPHRAAGCPFQAWSVAEALRLDIALG